MGGMWGRAAEVSKTPSAPIIICWTMNKKLVSAAHKTCMSKPHYSQERLDTINKIYA